MRRSSNRLLYSTLVFTAGLTFATVDAHAQAPQRPADAGQPSSFVVDSSLLVPTPAGTPAATTVKPKVKKAKAAPGTPTTVDVRILDASATAATSTTPTPILRTGDGTIPESAWAALRKCESNGNYAINTGNGYYGAYQFAAGTWRKLGYSGLPHEASPATQDEAARKLQAEQGWGPWPACTRKLGLR